MSKKWLLLIPKILVSAALIMFVVSRADLTAVEDRALQMAPEMLLLAALVFLVQYVVCAVRWRAALVPLGARISFFRVLRLLYIGTFFHQTLPASVGGDAVRTYLVYRDGVGLRAAISAIMLERLATVAGLVLVVALVQPAFRVRAGEAAAAWLGPVAMIGLAAVVGGTALLALLDRTPPSWRRGRLMAALANLAVDTRTVFFSPGPALRILGWAALGHANLVLSVFVLARGLGLDVGLIDCAALFLPVLLVTALPISVAGWGVREGSMVYAFGLIGVAAADAVVLSVLYGFLALVLALPGGVVWLATGARAADVAARLAEAEAPAPGRRGA
ncbi:MAG: lysylphosphatidylglycerol synthase transmembrane domain-containing protein [Rhodospirillales bacterium]|jgi:uncharacterized membrane protein YbhN (UPF0104 family)|nr:lysylphosphatidylglycerol synthase transmembrane domain-containing protein [Rhodospirillales bacterium]